MIYQGSKAKYADAIVPILQKIINKNNIQCYIEPFVGGANIIDKINCSIKIGYDKNYSLICLHNQAQKSMSTIPAHGSSEWWYEAKSIYQRYKGSKDMENEMEGWRIGAIQFLGSYNRGGFSRGYAITDKKHDYYNQAWINLAKQSENKNYKNIIFEHKNYEDLEINLNIPTLIYCDPPYENTKPYGYKFETEFDYNFYWNWIRELSKNYIVICSEQKFPEDFNIIWERKTKRTMNKTRTDAVEKLGTLNDLGRI